MSSEHGKNFCKILLYCSYNNMTISIEHPNLVKFFRILYFRQNAAFLFTYGSVGQSIMYLNSVKYYLFFLPTGNLLIVPEPLSEEFASKEFFLTLYG